MKPAEPEQGKTQEPRSPEEIAKNVAHYNRADSDHKKLVPRDWEATPEQWGEAHRRIQRAAARKPRAEKAGE